MQKWRKQMAKLVINNENKKSVINPDIYGNFSEHLGRCIYEGLYVGENSDIPNVNGMRTDVVEALKEMKLPVLRWPGGCFADEYHWMDGIGPKESRKRIVNTNWGGVVEDNSFGTHEFFELAKQLGCRTYINMNVGSGTVREMSEWVEYITFKGTSPLADLRAKNGHEEPWHIDYIGVGNENWGCGGNMRPQYYADEYRRYQTYIHNYGDNTPAKKIACGPSDGDYGWTRKVLETCFEHAEPKFHGFMDGLSLHHYTLPEMDGNWNYKGSATKFTEDIFYKTLKRSYEMEELVTRHGEIMDEFDKEKKIGLIVDEWGIWTDVEPGTNPGFLYQQNTMRDALVAGMNLNIFNNHSDRVTMANIAQMINVLQAVILTDGEAMIKTPTYYIFHMYRFHQGGTLLGADLLNNSTVGSGENVCPKITESVSEDSDGIITLTLTNNSLESAEDIEIQLTKDGANYNVSEAYIVTGKMDAHNTFENPDVVKEENFTAYIKTAEGVKVTLPVCSIVTLRLKK